MKHTNYEQPTLARVTLAATDILLTSGGGIEDPDVVAGKLQNTFTGARTEMKWSNIWG